MGVGCWFPEGYELMTTRRTAVVRTPCLRVQKLEAVYTCACQYSNIMLRTVLDIALLVHDASA